MDADKIHEVASRIRDIRSFLLQTRTGNIAAHDYVNRVLILTPNQIEALKQSLMVEIRELENKLRELTAVNE